MKSAASSLGLCLALLAAGCSAANGQLVTSSAAGNLGEACSHTPLPDSVKITRLGSSRRPRTATSSRAFAFRSTVCNLSQALSVSGYPSQGLRYRLQFRHHGKPTFAVTADATGKRYLFYETKTGSAYHTSSHFWSLVASAMGVPTAQLFR